MPTILAPGVYIEELPAQLAPIEGVATSTAGFIGVSQRVAPAGPLTSFAEFQQAAGTTASQFLSLAVQGFFNNGGTRCFVTSIAPTDPLSVGLNALADFDLQILCCPDEHLIANAAAALAAHCELRKDRFCILQSPHPVMPDATHNVPVQSSYAAYYYPWITVPGPGGASITIPPGGHVAGAYARIDTEHGVHTAPAGGNAVLQGLTGLSQSITDAQQTLLNSRGIDVIRSFPGQGILVWGARTTSEDREWMYVPVRRLMIFIEQSLYRGLQSVVFEPNGPALWAQVQSTVNGFLLQIWKQGFLAGSKPEEAIFVRCDQTTMPQADINGGRVIVQMGVAPLKPAEFILLRITCQLKPAS